MARKEPGSRNVIRIKHWPEGDRPRDRLVEKGPETLSDAGILSILLGSGGEGKDSLSLAREVLTALGGLRGLFSATYEDLAGMKGIGKAKAAHILAAMEILKRHLREPLQKLNLIQNLNDLHQYLSLSMRNLNRQEWRLLYLSQSRHLIAEEVLLRGEAGVDAIVPREIVRSAHKKKASALILAHNQLTGLPKATEEEIHLTRSLVKACWDEDIPILDHIIIGPGGHVSLRRRMPDLFEGEDEVA
ncbi:MAG: DNA repair protein RadC [Thermodesulfobacteriota bacterium]